MVISLIIVVRNVVQRLSGFVKMNDYMVVRYVCISMPLGLSKVYSFTGWHHNDRGKPNTAFTNLSIPT